MSQKVSRYFILLLAALFLASLACDDSADSPADEPGITRAQEPTEAPEPTDTPEPTEDPRASMTYLGDTVEDAGYSLSVVALEDPVEGSDYSSIYDGPDDGMRLVAVQLVIGNVSGDTVGTNPLSAALVDGDGFNYAAELGSRTDQLELHDLNHGDKVRGWIGFEIPTDAVPASVKYEYSMFPSVVLQAGVTEGP